MFFDHLLHLTVVLVSSGLQRTQAPKRVRSMFFAVDYGVTLLRTLCQVVLVAVGC